MNSKMWSGFFWMIAVCWISTATLNAQTGKTDPPPPSKPDQGLQEKTQQDKKAQIEEKLRQRRANWELVKDRMKTESNFFEFDDLLRLERAGFGESVLLDDDRNFDYFRDPIVLQELNLSAELSAQLGEQANEIAKEWKTAIRNASAHRDEMALQTYQDAIRIFDSQVELKLDKEQTERLQQIKFRSQIQRLEIPESIMTGLIEIEATDEEKKKLVLELKAEAKKIRSEGNRLFVEQVNSLFPGYLVGWQEQDTKNLPLLPIKLYLLLDENPKVVMGSFKSRFKEFDLTLHSGYWVFPTPLIHRERSGNLTLASNNSKWHQLPATSERTFHQFLRAELDESESVEHRRILNEFLAQMGVRTDPEFQSTRLNPPEGLSRDEKNAFRMRQRIEINQELDDGFREQNLIPYRNYIRLHALFTLGPDFVYERLTQENRDQDNIEDWPNEEEFRKSLAASSAVMAAFIDSQESRLVDLLVAQIKSLDKSSQFTPSTFASPLSSQYEMTLLPILEYGEPGALLRRR